VAVAVLAELVRLASNSVPKEMKARHLKTLLVLIEELNLHSVVPNLAKSLSRGTREVLDGGTRALLDRMTQLGELKRKNESLTHQQAVFDGRWKKEAKYADALQKRIPVNLSSMVTQLRAALGAKS
jgi:hypothetical protein